jgi:predicted ferric reductase
MTIAKEELNKKLILALYIFSILPFIYLLIADQSIPSFWYRLANISGYIGGVALIWQFVLGNRGVSKYLTSDYDWSLRAHIFLGINGALFVLLHPILEAIVYLKDIRFIFQLDYSSDFNTAVSIGRVAFYLFLLVWFSSSVFRNSFKYRVWLYIHYLSYPMLLAVLVHPKTIGSLLLTYAWLDFYWLFLSILSALFFIVKLKDIFNIGSAKFKLKEKSEFPGGNFIYTFEPVSHRFTSKIGQYFYIKKDFFGEAHPFTIFRFNEPTGEISFGIKLVGKYTQDLAKLNLNEVVYIDGPYGEFTFEGQNSEPKVIIAGGIGITPFYELVKRYGNEKTYMFYANQLLDYALSRDEFKKMLGDRYFDCISGEKIEQQNVICDFLTAEGIKKNLPADIVNNAKFFICGSPGFMRAEISNLESIGVRKSQIYIEEFGY